MGLIGAQKSSITTRIGHAGQQTFLLPSSAENVILAHGLLEPKGCDACSFSIPPIVLRQFIAAGIGGGSSVVNTEHSTPESPLVY